MSKPKTQLYRTEITIWTDWNPVNCELEDLAREATHGDAYCSRSDSRPARTAPESVRSFFGEAT